MELDFLKRLITTKPLIEIGGMPILWHIMKIYENIKFQILICLGYKGYLIKEFFANYVRHMSDMTIDFKATGGLSQIKY